MGIIQTLDKYELQAQFKAYDRDYYSLDGYQAMIDMFEETGTNYEIDVIALCCDFSEASIEDIRKEYDLDEEEYPEDSDVLDWLNYRTYAMELDNGAVLYQAF